MKHFLLPIVNLRRRIFVLVFALTCLVNLSIAQTNGVLLNGTTDYVLLPNSSTLKPTNNFTIEAWVYSNATLTDPAPFSAPPTPQYEIISSEADGVSTIQGYHLVVYNGKLRFWTHDYSTVVDGASTLSAGNWYHVAVSFSTTDGIRLYVNGTQDAHMATVSGPISYPNSYAPVIGRLASSSHYFWNGVIDEVRIWNVVRSASEISSKMNCQFPSTYTGLVGYYKLNESSGTTAADNSGNGLDGSLGGSASWTTGNVSSNCTINSSLSSLTISSGSLSPAFSSGTTSYSASVSHITNNITVTPTVPATSTVQVKVNSGSYASVTSGSASGSLNLNVGSNTISVRVTGEDGATTTTYTVTVCRAATASITSNNSPICTGSTATFTVDGSPNASLSYNIDGGSATSTTLNGSGTANIDVTSATANTTLNILSVTMSGCSANSLSGNSEVLVNGVIAGNTIGSDASICHNTTASITGSTPTGGGGSYTYLWESASSLGGSYAAAAGTNNTAAYTTATLTTSSTQTYFRRKVTSGGCTSYSSETHITVNALPVIAEPSGSSSVCAGSTGNVYTTVAGFSNYAWLVTGGSITAGGSATDTFVTVTWGSAGTGHVLLNYQDGNSCTAAAASDKSVGIHANPTASIAITETSGTANNDATICSGSSATFSATGSTAGSGSITGYLWSNSSTASSISVSNNSNYSVTVTNSNGCSTTSSNSAITVHNNPVASFSISDATQCLTGNTFTIASTSSNGSGTINSIVWSASGASPAPLNVASPASFSYASAGQNTINLTVSDNNGCTSSTAFSNNVVLYSMPTADFSINDVTQCLVGNSFEVTNGSSVGSAPIASYSWTASGASPSLSGASPSIFAYASAGTKTINLQVTDTNGCSHSTSNSGNVTVWSMPIASFSVNDPSQCFVGNSYVFTNTSTNGSGGIASWTWTTTGADVAGMTGVGPHTRTYATHGDYTVNLSVTDSNGCTHATALSNNMRVYQHPTASYTVTESSGNTNNDYEICTGATVNFNGSSSSYGFGASSLTYQWRRDASNAPGTGNTSALYSPAVYGVTNPDQFDYTLIVTDNNGCTSSAFTNPDTTIIYVYPFPVPSFTTPNVGAQGMYGTLGDNGNGGQLLCHGKVIFANTSTIPSGSIVQYRWNYGDGSGTDTVTTADNMKHEFPVNPNINWFDAGFPNTQYTITLIARSDEGCVVTTTGTRDIKNGPDAIIGLADTVVQSLTGNSFLFENNSNNQHPSFITNSKWVWGDNDSTTLTTFVPKVYTTAGEYRVHLITYTLTGCTDTAYLDLTILPTPTASYSSAQNSCSNRNVSFTNTSVLASSYAWNFGDGNSSTSASPTHTYAADGMYIVSLSINSGASTTTDTIYVVTTPVMSSINASYNPCGNGFDFSSSATGYNLTYSWSFTNNVGSGTTSTSTSASRVFATTDSAAVTFTATAHGLCSATSFLGLASVPVATPTPTAGVSVTAADNCSGTRTINNSSTNATDYGVSVDGGSFATVTTFPYDITGLSAGAHSVRLVAHNAGSCPDTATASFNVASVVAAFSGVPATCGTSVAFSSTGSSATYGGLTYSWNFNSGEGSSTSSAPSYTFATSGSKSVQLTVTSAASGCAASTTSSVTASAVTGPVAAFTTATAAGTCTNGIAFTNTTSGSGNTYSWDFGDGSTATNTHPTKHYGTSGAFTVTLTAVNGSCSSTATASVNIPSTNGGSAAGFVEANSAYSQPISSNSFNFFNTSTHLGAGYNATYSWDFGDGTTGSNTFVYGKTYASIGTYEVTLTAVSGNGCVSTAKQTVNVTSNATSSFSYTPNACGNRNVAFTSTATSASSYTWNFGDGQTSSVANPTHTYSADGSYSVTLTVNGNTTSSAQTVTVATTPVLGSITSSMNACSKRYTFGMSATGTALTYAWTFSGGTGTTSTTSSASRSYASSGAQTVDLIVTADGRCSANATQISFTADAAVVAPSAGLLITEAVPNSDTRTVNNTSTNATTFSVSVDGAAYATVTSFPYDITGLSNGSHTVSLVASIAGVCPDTTTSTFTVSTTTCAAVANFSVSGGLSTQPLATNRFDFFNSTTHTGFGWVTRYAWNFGDGTVDTINTFAYGKTYASAGTYAVTLTATSSVDGCTSTKTVNVTVTPSATASFTSTPNSCSDRTVAFTSTSVSASSYSWDFGDGNTSTSANPSHTYAADGNYTVILTTNGTTASSPATVTVATTPTSVVISNSVSACGNTYTFSASATGFNKTYAWSFTNLTGSTSGSGSSVTRTYSSSGFDTASVIVTADGRCAATVSTANLAVVATMPTVTAALQVTTSNYCGTSRTINNVGSANADSFMVSVDNGTYTTVSSFPYTISGLSVGTHNVALKAMGSGCDDVETNSFIVGSISASFTSSSSSCGPSVSFTNTSTSTAGTLTYDWDFNGESASTSENPTYSFAASGYKDVTLTVTNENGCTATYNNDSVYANVGTGNPVASFTSTMVVNGSCNTGILFNASGSTGSTNFLWSYGDGTVSILSSTSTIFHAYASTGTFSVTLTAYNACGTPSTSTANVVVTATGLPTPEVSFSTDYATQCITGNRFDFFNRTILNGWGWVGTYHWYFGDGTSDLTNTHTYGKTYATPGTYTVKLVGISNLGCSDSSTLDVVVLAPGACTPGKMRDGINGRLYSDNNDLKGGKAATTGVQRNADLSDEVILYPNPNSGDFKLELRDINSKSVSVSIVDMLGREVYTNKYLLNGAKEIDLYDMNLAPGTYNLILIGNDEITARKQFAVIK